MSLVEEMSGVPCPHNENKVATLAMMLQHVLKGTRCMTYERKTHTHTQMLN